MQVKAESLVKADPRWQEAMHKRGVTDFEHVMIDPWPGVKGDGKDRGQVPAALESAHRDKNFHALVYYWVGWS